MLCGPLGKFHLPRPEAAFVCTWCVCRGGVRSGVQKTDLLQLHHIPYLKHEPRRAGVRLAQADWHTVASVLLKLIFPLHLILKIINRGFCLKYKVIEKSRYFKPESSSENVRILNSPSTGQLTAYLGFRIQKVNGLEGAHHPIYSYLKPAMLKWEG